MKLKSIIVCLILSLLPMNFSCSLLKSGTKYAAKKTLKNSFAKVTKYTGKYGKYVFGKGVKYCVNPTKEIKLLSSNVGKRHLTSAKRRFVNAKENEVTNLFGSKVSTPALQQLRKDVLNKSYLIKELKRNPNALRVYDNALASTFRDDITFLRYWANNADKLYDKGFKQFGKGENIVFKDIRGATEISDQYGNKLGKIIKGNGSEKYVIDLTNAERNTLANLYHMSNTKYIRGNQSFLTDEYGRVIECRVKIDKSVQAFGRDRNMIKKIRDVKNQYGTDGTQLGKIRTTDDGGHLVADSWGGQSDFLNIVPQNSQVNQSGIWKTSEINGLNLAKEGNVVERIIKLDYPNSKTLRPSKFWLNQQVNGNTVVSETFDNI